MGATHFSFSVGSPSEPLSYAVQSPVGNSSAVLTNDNPQLAFMSGIVMTTVKGSVVSFGGEDQQVNFNFYEERSRNIFGDEACTFGGYVVQG